MTNVKPFTFDGIVPGGASSITTGTVNFPLTAYNVTLGSEAGYYFWGILDNATAGKIDYNFQLVEQNADKKYAISSKAKTVTEMNINKPTAIKLSGLTNNGKFVSLGYAGGPLWATGNIGKVNDGEAFNTSTNSVIVDPLLPGEYFTWGRTMPYNEPGGTSVGWGGEDPLPTDYDVAYQTNNIWRLPTLAQLQALMSNNTVTWVTNWTNNNPPSGGWNPSTKHGGCLVTSNTNGISLFLVVEGFWEDEIYSSDYSGYWSCNYPKNDDNLNNRAYYLGLSTYNNTFNTGYEVRRCGYCLRPVKN